MVYQGDSYVRTLGAFFKAHEDSKYLMQYTGLLCHGNEVYEGDLLERNSSTGKGKVIGEVYFDEGQFRIKWHPKEKGWNNSLYIHVGECEVIGNIHLNPELLTNN